MALYPARLPDIDGQLASWMLAPLFDWEDSAARESSTSFPMDVVERSEAFVLRADAPGMDPGDVTVEVKDGVLTVKGDRKQQEEEKDEEGCTFRTERSHRRFERRFKLAKNVDTDGISATLERGVLTVKVPKVEVTPPAPKRIKVTEGRAKL